VVHADVRILLPQPGIPVLGQASQETREWAGNPGFLRIRFRLRIPGLPNLRRKSPKVSNHLREYSRFAETVGGDSVRSRLPPEGEHCAASILGSQSLQDTPF
jgi:hypothetical protein